MFVKIKDFFTYKYCKLFNCPISGGIEPVNWLIFNDLKKKNKNKNKK